MSPGQNLAEVLLGRADRADRVAVREREREWTYGELSAQAARVGGALVSLGVLPGDRVAVLMPDCLETVAVILGTLRVGAVSVPISELARQVDIKGLVSHAGAVVAVVHASLEPAFDEVRREIPSLREVIVLGGAKAGERAYEALVATAAPAPVAPCQPGDPALILYSGGAGGEPKGVVHSHATPLGSFRAFGQGALALSAQDRVFSAAKLSTSFGLGAGLVFPLAAGGQALLLRRQPRSEAIFDILRELEPTVMFATPSQYGQLLTDAPDGAQPFAPLRACVAGGEALPVTLAGRFHGRFGVELLGCYGLTEAFHTVIASTPGNTHPGAVGVVVPGFRARVVDDEGKPLGPGEIGTLEVSGPSIGKSYWDQPDETAGTFRGEWLRTGDRFLVDADGYYFHVGRADDLFKVGGKWVSPIEVERALLAHEAVWECAVVGIEDDNGLIKPFAFVVPNIGRTPGPELEQELIEHVKREIAPYKYPRWVEFVDALPKGPNGRVLRYKLRARPRRRHVDEVPA